MSLAVVAVIEIAESLRVHGIARGREARARCIELLDAMGIPAQGDNEVFVQYEERVTQRERGTLTTLEASVNGQPVTAVKFTGGGLWGQITGVLAVRPDLSRIVGIDIIDHNETPGLGGRIAEDWFRDQFRGERIVTGHLVVATGTGGGDEDHENGAVDGITGASRTSDSMEIMLNRALSQLQEVLP